MNSLRKILVVDNGHRETIDSLSAELAELGVSSVTASFEAAEDVLEVIDPPSAIFLKMPGYGDSDDHTHIMQLAETLRRHERTAGVPVIIWDMAAPDQYGGISALLRTEVGSHVFAAPEL